MKTRLLRMTAVLILATIVLTPGLGLGAGAARQALQPAESAAPASGTTTRVSVASDGSQGNDSSNGGTISADGRYVAFDSDAINLVSEDTNGARDVFVHDRQTGSTERVSVDSDGSQGNDGSGGGSISANGRYVAFVSWATNLVIGDTYGLEDVFVHDRQTGATERVSLANDGSQGNDWSGSYGLSISADGRYVAFTSNASNLVSGDANEEWDIFVYDRQISSTELVSVASDGSQGNSESMSPSISADGRFVIFGSWSSNLAAGDTNQDFDVFVHDRQSGGTERVSVASDGTQGNDRSWYFGLSISADGRYVAFSSNASNLVSGDTNNFCDIDGGGVFDDNCLDIFVHDRLTGITQRVSVASDGSQGNGDSYESSISSDGRYVAFLSLASNLVSGDINNFCDTDFDGIYDDSCRDIFIHDLQTGSTELVSVDSDGSQGNDSSWISSISADGRYVALNSKATNLVGGDTNEAWDVFVHDRGERNFLLYLPVTQNQP